MGSSGSSVRIKCLGDFIVISNSSSASGTGEHSTRDGKFSIEIKGDACFATNGELRSLRGLLDGEVSWSKNSMKSCR